MLINSNGSNLFDKLINPKGYAKILKELPIGEGLN